MRQVTVTIEEHHRAEFAEISEQLQRSGMEVDSVLEELGLVTGSTSDPAILRHVKGVQSVDEGLDYQLPDSDADIQ